MDHFQRHSNAPIHRGVYELAREATDALRGRPRADRRVRELGPDVLDLHPQRHRGDQPRGLRVGPRATSAPATRCSSREMEHHSNIVPWQMLCEETGATLRYLTLTDSGELSLDELDAVLARGPREAGRRRARVERAGHDQPGRRDRRAGARGRRGDARRRLAGGAADAGRPARARRGLLRLDRPQGARPHRSGCCTAGASCWRRCGPSSAAAT